jgi:hypothetical protein
MTTWTWSYLIWGLRWLLIGFLGFELVAQDVTGLAPWMSLTATGRHAVRTYPIVGPLIFATVVFLTVHFLYDRPVWKSLAYGLIVAFVAHWMDGRL